ncbi:hypothetical protein V2J09_012601 [Rumex salicifolius]
MDLLRSKFCQFPCKTVKMEAVVSGLVGLVLEKLGSATFAKIGQIFKVQDELKRLQNTMSSINAVLLDAEEQQSTNNAVRNWLLNLRDVIYDIEDLLDLISTEDLEAKIIRKDLGKKIAQFCSRYSFAEKLKAVRRKLDEIAENKRNYSFHDNLALPSPFRTAETRETWYPFYRTDIINMWMALGFLQVQNGSEDAIDVGHRSFLQLPCVERRVIRMVEAYNYLQGGGNLLQMSSEHAISQAFTGLDGKITCTEMHDVVHDLAAYVAGDEIATISSNMPDLSPRVKHIMMDTKDVSGIEFPNVLLNAGKVRSFASVGSVSKLFLEKLVSSFKCLRVLLLLHSDFEELPDSIGNLKQLRYLNASRNARLKLLPKSTSKLVNLQVLHLEYCYQLNMLPKNMQNLTSLRVLVLTSKMTCFPERVLHGWISLQVLKIRVCQNLTLLPEELGSLRSLRILVIHKCPKLASLPNSMTNLTNLEHLTIHNCKKLDLNGWKGLRDLKSLKFLIIFVLPKMLVFPHGIESAAGSLQYLRISGCKELRSLPEDLTRCTCLLKLQVFNCPKLGLLPREFDKLEALQELRLSGCPELSRRCQHGGGDWQLISHIPEIYIDEVAIKTRYPTTMFRHGTEL